MFYVKTNPYFNLAKEFDNLFDDVVSKDMKVDIIDNKDNYLVTAEVAGVRKEDISVNVANDTLTIKVKEEKKENHENDNKYTVKERYTKNYERSFYLEGMDEENIKAKYEDGILTVVIKKLAKKSNKTIAIE